MSRLFDRTVSVSAGPRGAPGREYRDLRIDFDVNHSGGRAPSRARITVYNLSPQALALFKPRSNLITLKAGHGEISQVLFTGNPVRDGVTYRNTQSGDRILEVEVSDGGSGFTAAPIVKTYQNTTWDQIMADVLGTTDWLRGEWDVPPGIAAPGSTTVIDKPTDIVERFAQLIPGGGNWWVRDNTLYVKAKNVPTAETALLLSRDAGNLIGTPTPTSKGCKVQAILDSTMRPGRQFQVTHPLVTGLFMATDVRFTGSSGYGNQFYMDITGKTPGVD